jgi:hypothetical protein
VATGAAVVVVVLPVPFAEFDDSCTTTGSHHMIMTPAVLSRAVAS